MTRMHTPAHAVTVLISRRIRPGCEAQFERIAQQLLEVASRAPGYLGAHLMHPGEEPEVHDSLYHVVLAFDSQKHLEAWQRSPERELGLAAAEPCVDGRTTERSVSGLALWFQGPSASAPPRWKVAAVTWIGICPTVYLLFLVLWRWIENWWLLPRVMLLTLLVASTMTWVVAPVLTRVFRNWLNKPARAPT